MTNTKPELLACPFCGGTAIRARTPSTVIECDSCHAVAFLAAWNRRATAPAEVGDGVPVPVMPGNWPEDASHENGDYECRCVTCEQTFYGHKRRVICKVCAKPAALAEAGDAEDLSVVGLYQRAFGELLATVRGECPSLLNEDSGGGAVLIDLVARVEAMERNATRRAVPDGWVAVKPGYVTQEEVDHAMLTVQAYAPLPPAPRSDV